MKIEIKNIDKTKLNALAFEKVVKRFARNQRPLQISFDGRLASFGYYTYNSKKKKHNIKISTKIFQFKDDISRVYELLSTLLHEINHLQQQEKFGSVVFESKEFAWNEKIKSLEGSDYYSIRECESRAFEEKNVLKATEYYWKNCDYVIK